MSIPFHFPTDSGPQLNEQQVKFMDKLAPQTVQNEMVQSRDDFQSKDIYKVFTNVLRSMNEDDADLYLEAEGNDVVRQQMYNETLFNTFAPSGVRKEYQNLVTNNQHDEAADLYNTFQSFWDDQKPHEQLGYMQKENRPDLIAAFENYQYTRLQELVRDNEPQVQQQAPVKQQQPQPKINVIVNEDEPIIQQPQMVNDPNRIDSDVEIELLYDQVGDLFSDDLDQRAREIVTRGAEKDKRLFGKVAMNDHLQAKVNEFGEALSDPNSKGSKDSKQIFKDKAKIDQYFQSKEWATQVFAANPHNALDVTSRTALEKFSSRQAQALLESAEVNSPEMQAYAQRLIKLQALENHQATVRGAQDGLSEDSEFGREQRIVENINANMVNGLITRAQTLPKDIVKQSPSSKMEIQ
jgi:hypothetical protein